MASNLTNLSLNEVSAVDDGANPHAHIVLFKAKGTAEMTPAEIEKKLGDTETDLKKAREEAAVLKSEVEKAKTEKADLEKKLADVTKAADEAKTAVTKAAEDLKKAQDENKVLTEKALDASLLAEVQKSYPKSKGTDAEKVAMLKAIKAVPDESVRKSMTEALVQAEKLAATFEKENGTKKDVEKSSTGDPAKDLDEMVAKHATEKKITKAKAYSEVLKTEDGKKLYAESRAAK